MRYGISICFCFVSFFPIFWFCFVILSFLHAVNLFFLFSLKKNVLGSRLCFHKGRNKEWQDVEDFARSESCGKEENGSASAYKVAVSAFQLL